MKKIIYKDNMDRILEWIMIITLIILIGVVHLIGRSVLLTYVVAGFSLVIIMVMFFYKVFHKTYIENILVQLSDLLDTIINISDDPIFSTTEDTIFSKLQFQTIKLTNILKKKNKQIKEERDEIKALISDIAHQLKTPLTNLKMYGEFLQDESLSKEERKEFNEIMILSLNRLTFLVESMIKMSRLESGVIQLRSQRNNLNDTVLRAIAQVQKRAKEKNIDIKLEEQDKIEINFDKNWIFEAVLNILDNAIKYTPSNGEIQVKLQSYEMFSRIDIIDNGIGILEEEIALIFKRFSRGKNVGDVEGIGIGLYLTQEIISMHGGYVKVNSSQGKTKFSLFVPIDINKSAY